MKMTDGKRTVEIEMKVWTPNGYTPDWSIDFFVAGSIPHFYDERLAADVYQVDDVDACIEWATDWRDSKGDFSDDEPCDDNRVFVTDI